MEGRGGLVGVFWLEWVVSEGGSRRVVKCKLVCGESGSRLVEKVGVGWYGRLKWIGREGRKGLVWKVEMGWYGR